jgi:hypothetical protein
MNVELGDITEVGEETLAHDIQRRGPDNVDELKRSVAGIPAVRNSACSINASMT